MDEIFKALADPQRRSLLDQLFVRDGQSLGELCEGATMTRFGIMKHLAILERAGLVTTHRSGRQKLHFLNPVPLRLIHDRWTSKYAAPFTAALGAIKQQLEEAMPEHDTPMHLYEIYIRTTPQALWEAITNPDFTRRYFYGTAVESSFRSGEPIVHKGPNGEAMLEGRIIEVDPPRRLVHTFAACHDPEQSKDRPSRVTWTIEPLGEVCKLTLRHDDFDGRTKTYESTGPGWNPVLSGLKTLLETGKPLAIPMG